RRDACRSSLEVPEQCLRVRYGCNRPRERERGVMASAAKQSGAALVEDAGNWIASSLRSSQ
ncbi:MAG TPA: hypothetical protein VEA60_14225, partial [Allosphingosinicella sp.]|nr:hypothetical protein [Allosphingosinicella sp.]